jgi:flagellar biosynthesis anti-sigma factor FlgM
MEINPTNSLRSLEKKYQTTEMQVAGKDRQLYAKKVLRLDHVELSNYGRDVSRLNDLIYAVPDVRESRVEEVIFTIESGAYNVKAEQVAEKIMGGDLLNEFI